MAHYVSLVVGVVYEAATAVVACIRTLVRVNSWG